MEPEYYTLVSEEEFQKILQDYLGDFYHSLVRHQSERDGSMMDHVIYYRDKSTKICVAWYYDGQLKGRFDKTVADLLKEKKAMKPNELSNMP